MSNQTPQQPGNPGENQAPPYGQPPMGGPGGPGHPAHHPGMMPMGPGMPYPPYMMYPMGAPYFMPPPHPDMGVPQMMPPEMQFQGQPMMPMPFGFVPGPHMMPGGSPVSSQLNPNVPTFVPSGKQQKSSGASPKAKPTTSSAESVPPESSRASVVSEPAAVSSPKNSSVKPVSRRLPIIDPTTGKEISFAPSKTTGPAAPPASALVSADVALGANAPVRPLIVTMSSAGEASSSEKGPAVPPPSSEQAASSSTNLTSTPSEPVPVVAEEVVSPSKPSGMRMKLKNAPISKPVASKAVVVVMTNNGQKPLRRVRNISLPGAKRRVQSSSEDAVISPAVEKPSSSGSKFKLVNKSIAAAKPVPSMLPIPREVFLNYLSLVRPDRNAPSSINVFPSELLGLRTAPHGDPALGRRRTGAGGLQKSMSQVSTGSNWRGGKLGRTLSRQTSRGGRTLVNQAVKPSERGFKIIDQSSLSEKDKLRRQVMSLLNKMTVDSFQAITNQIADIEISQPWQMDVVIGLIFDKAVVEHSYSEMYAEMCKKLRTTWPELTGVDQETGQSVPVTFTRAIIEKCQVEFDAMPDVLAPTEADVTKARGNPEDLEMFMQKRKERILGNMKFIAQLFLMRILSSRVIRSVVEQLLFRTEEPEEHYIECIGILLHNIGATLMDSESGRAYVDQFVERMQELMKRECYGKRIRFMMQDVVDAAQAGWEGKHAGSRLASAAKSKEEVRKAALDESKPKAPPARRVSEYQPRQQQQFKPTGVLRRADELKATQAKIQEDEDWSNQDEDEVSEYESSSSSLSEQESEQDGFTKVDSTKRR